MSRRGRALALAALVLAFSACGGVARSIDIPRLPGPQGHALVPATLTGYMVRPEGTGPFPAVVNAAATADTERRADAFVRALMR
jgi:hypothetical protein